MEKALLRLFHYLFMNIEIAQIPLRLKLPSGGFSLIAEKRYRAFFSGKKPKAELEVNWRKGRTVPFTPSVSEFRGKLEIKRGDFFCRLDAASLRGELKISPDIQAFDSFLRTFYSWLLPSRGGVLLHSSAVARKGRGFVFFGRSGAGKSTAAKMSRGKSVILTDEITPVRVIRGGARVYGSPFWGEMSPRGRNMNFPLRGLLSLKKSDSDSITPLPPGEILSRLLKTVLCFSKDKSNSAKILDTVTVIAGKAGCGELKFSLKGRFWGNIDEDFGII